MKNDKFSQKNLIPRSNIFFKLQIYNIYKKKNKKKSTNTITMVKNIFNL